MKLPTDSAARKALPITTGVLDYFPLALAEVARVSRAGNDHHNPGEPLHWSREKSSDHADCIARHLLERGTRDADGQLHSAKLAWRALALLQLELEALDQAQRQVRVPFVGQGLLQPLLGGSKPEPGPIATDPTASLPGLASTTGGLKRS